jgi:hypothetical protein
MRVAAWRTLWRAAMGFRPTGEFGELKLAAAR